MKIFKWLKSLLNPTRLFNDEPWMYDSLNEGLWLYETHSEQVEIQFAPSQWAPGIWAGTEGWTFSRAGTKYRILLVDLENRSLLIKPIYWE